MPELDPLFAGFPAQVDELIAAVRWKINQALINVFEFASQVLKNREARVKPLHRHDVFTAHLTAAIAARVRQSRLNCHAFEDERIAELPRFAQQRFELRDERIRIFECKCFQGLDL